MMESMVPRQRPAWLTNLFALILVMATSALLMFFCRSGPPEAHLAKLQNPRDLGVDQFALYDLHDAKESAIDAYGERVIPAVNS